MKKSILWFAIWTCVVVTGCRETTVTDVSIINLIASPGKYDGHEVRVSGFLHLEFEGDGIYLTRDDFLSSQYKNGLWVSLDANARSGAAKFNNQYVVITGKFHADDKGHMAMWSGTITDVSQILKRPEKAITP
jgi:hypothetical protein